MDPLNIVVVGLGRAGQCRVRDMVAETPLPDTQLPNVTLKGFASRRADASVPGAQKVDLDAALADKEVNAVIICNENAKHEPTARQALEAGKHVLVEFPLATTSDAAKNLYQLAESKGLVLYEEDISLLTATFTKSEQLIKEKGLKAMEISVKGRANGWIENFAASGPPFVTGISMLHRVIGLTVKVVATDAYIKRTSPEVYEAQAKLTANDNVVVTLNYSRDPSNPPRRVTFSYSLGDGSELTDKTIQMMIPQDDYNPRYGLFMKDTVQFMRTVRGQRDMTDQKRVTLRALELADDLYRLAKASPQSSGL